MTAEQGFKADASGSVSAYGANLDTIIEEARTQTRGFLGSERRFSITSVKAHPHVTALGDELPSVWEATVEWVADATAPANRQPRGGSE